MMRRTMVVLALALVACHVDPPHTEQDLSRYVGRSINDYINEKHFYPDSDSALPNGGKVYRFSTGQGNRNVRCFVWIETDGAGLITHYRSENCW